MEYREPIIVPNRKIRRFMERHNCSRQEAEEILLKPQDQFFHKKKRQYNKRIIATIKGGGPTKTKEELEKDAKEIIDKMFDTLDSSEIPEECYTWKER